MTLAPILLYRGIDPKLETVMAKFSNNFILSYGVSCAIVPSAFICTVANEHYITRRIAVCSFVKINMHVLCITVRINSFIVIML